VPVATPCTASAALSDFRLFTFNVRYVDDEDEEDEDSRGQNGHSRHSHNLSCALWRSATNHWRMAESGWLSTENWELGTDCHDDNDDNAPSQTCRGDNFRLLTYGETNSDVYDCTIDSGL
jgi:hypothetical protein